jgi:hypothetical protein
MHQAELLNSFEDVKGFLEEQGLNIIKVGYDKPKDFHYLTIENQSGKMRIKGEIYNEEFWSNSRKNRTEQVSNNRRNPSMGSTSQRGFDELKTKLEQYNSKRKREVNKQYKPARQRAEKRFEERELENTRKPQGKGKKRTPLFTLKPNIASHLYHRYKFISIPVTGQQVNNTKKISNRARWKSFRSDTQERFIREQKRKIFLFFTKGKELNERIIRRGFRQIREKRSIGREREKQLFEQIEISNDKLSRKLKTAKQELHNNFTESRTGMERNITNNAEQSDEKIVYSDSKDRNYEGRVRDIFDRLNERVEDITKSIKGVINEVSKIKLFKKGKEEYLLEQRYTSKQIYRR